MANLLTIKPYIHEYIRNNLSPVFADKVYWIGERRFVPGYPYCVLSIIAESKDKRTSHHSGKLVEFSESGQSNAQTLREDITTRYKTCTITVGVYNAWVQDAYDTQSMDEAKEFTYAQIDNLEGAFENYPLNSNFSVQNISPIRPLHEPVSGGYMYRYEFDLTIGYNEVQIVEKVLGGKVEGEFVDKQPNDDIKTNFEVAVDNNDNIVVEIT